LIAGSRMVASSDIGVALLRPWAVCMRRLYRYLVVLSGDAGLNGVEAVRSDETVPLLAVAWTDVSYTGSTTIARWRTSGTSFSSAFGSLACRRP
jgi:hypothetical protein